VATHLAVGNTGRKDRFKTAVPSPPRWVTTADNVTVVNESSVRLARELRCWDLVRMPFGKQRPAWQFPDQTTPPRRAFPVPRDRVLA
jgi:hypothetical protein